MVTSYLLQIRTDKGYSQSQLAKATGISARTIRNIELEINPPCLENALRFAAYLDVPVESLFKLDDTYQSQSI